MQTNLLSSKLQHMRPYSRRRERRGEGRSDQGLQVLRNGTWQADHRRTLPRTQPRQYPLHWGKVNHWIMADNPSLRPWHRGKWLLRYEASSCNYPRAFGKDLSGTWLFLNVPHRLRSAFTPERIMLQQLHPIQQGYAVRARLFHRAKDGWRV